MSVEIRLLGSGDAYVLERVATGVFDNEVDARWTREFFADSRHHIVVALDASLVVGMVSAVHYVHPDKAPQLFINEVGVAGSHRRQGLGREMLAKMLEHGRSLGCTEAWLGTEDDNAAARGLYEAADGVDKGEPFILYTFNFKK
jgi:aminoglycoside 6'-N-acetyltransferase I